ncbi:MAG: hypothetical protein KAY37_08000 [Phycisphaerae bacterium]|nr:hypothetical protein [Phycisphaerae bacterium]
MFSDTRLVLAILTTLIVAVSGCRQGDRMTPTEQPPALVETVEEHWPNGMLRVRKEVVRAADGTFSNHGRYECWYDTGQKEYEGFYVQGKLHGVETRWHKNGRKQTEQHYEHGLRQGPRRDWDDHGRLRKEEHYLDNKPHGTWTIRKENGEIKWRQRFDHGVPLP